MTSPASRNASPAYFSPSFGAVLLEQGVRIVKDVHGVLKSDAVSAGRSALSPSPTRTESAKHECSTKGVTTEIETQRVRAPRNRKPTAPAEPLKRQHRDHSSVILASSV